jgi:hypothetical protein
VDTRSDKKRSPALVGIPRKNEHLWKTTLGVY